LIFHASLPKRIGTADIFGREGDFESLPAGFSTENEEKEVPEQKGKDGKGGNDIWEKKGVGSTATFPLSSVGAVNVFSSDDSG
jgi:hypothetical protein